MQKNKVKSEVFTKKSSLSPRLAIQILLICTFSPFASCTDCYLKCALKGTSDCAQSRYTFTQMYSRLNIFKYSRKYNLLYLK